MENIDIYTEKIYLLLDEAVKKNPPNAILLSGWIDSSAIAYLWKKYNPDMVWITVISDNSISPDQNYANLVAKRLWIKSFIATLRDEEIIPAIENVVLSLENFNIYWVSAALVLYKWLEEAAKLWFNKIATWEWSDSLFWSFPVMLNWKFWEKNLIDFIENRLLDIDIMTAKVWQYNNIDFVLPYHDKDFKEFILSIPLDKRMHKDLDWNHVTKFLLRETFRRYLPEDVVNRPQTQAFTWASTLDILSEKFKEDKNISLYNEKYWLKFGTLFEAYLFNILDSHGKYKPIDWEPKCIFCWSKLRCKDSVHCNVCATLQYNNEILAF